MISSKQKPTESKLPSYSACHKWLARWHKKKDSCEFCSSTKHLEWALKKGKQHCYNVKNYLTLCSSCHKKYDYTDERKKKLSNSLKGRKITWKDKISVANKGRKLSEKHKNQVREYQIKNPKKRNNKGQFIASPRIPVLVCVTTL